MPFSLKNALLRDRSPFARPDLDVPRTIDARMARDIGMSDTEVERHRFRWPSQTFRHPRV